MLYPQSTAYVIEALGYLASLPADKPIKAKELARVLQVSDEYLSKVLSQLVRKKFVRSTKGPLGGFQLTVDPTKITLYRIMAATDSLSKLEEECVMGLRTCTSLTPCAFHHNWVKFKENVVAEAQRLTLSELSHIVIGKLKAQDSA